MTKQKSLIGALLDSSHRTIEASQLNRLHAALLHPNSFAQNRLESKREQTSFLPPFLMGNLINLPFIYKVLGLNINTTLLSRETIISHRYLSLGDTVSIKTFLKNAYEQQASSNPLGFIILESIGQVDKDLAFYCERVIAVRGGFQRGRS